MPSTDATDLYLAQIYAGPMPDPDQQLRWIARIERAQQRFNQALSECPSLWPALLANLRTAQTANRLTRVIARCIEPDELASRTQLLIECLADASVTSAQIAECLSTLRLRTECCAALCAVLQHHMQLGIRPRTATAAKVMHEALQRINRTTDLLVRANQRLVASIARQYRSGPLAFMDLVQEGNLGLLRAIERFDPARGTRVSTYALWWVRRAMVYAIARQGQTVRPSVAQYWESRQVLRASERLERTQGYISSHADTARQLGLSVANLHQAQVTQAPILALDAPLPNTDGVIALERLTEACQPEPEQSAQHRDLYRTVRMLLDRLPARHAKILRMRFGIDVRDDCTLEQIAQQQGVTRERIRQLEAQALQALREVADTWMLQEVL